MGRFWGRRTGKHAAPLVPPVVEVIADVPKRLAPVIRIARKLARHAAIMIGRRSRSDGGTGSVTLWDVGGRVAPALRPDLWEKAAPAKPGSASQGPTLNAEWM